MLLQAARQFISSATGARCAAGGGLDGLPSVAMEAASEAPFQVFMISTLSSASSILKPAAALQRW